MAAKVHECKNRNRKRQLVTVLISNVSQCQRRSKASLLTLYISIIMINDGHPACLALQLFWVSNYSLFINNYISWVFFLFLTIENERFYCNLVIVVNGFHKIWFKWGQTKLYMKKKLPPVCETNAYNWNKKVNVQ